MWEGLLWVGLVLAGMWLMAPDRSEEQVIARLEALLPELRYGRETHRQWHDYLTRHPQFIEQRPELGDAAFHQRMIEVYDERIDAITEAIHALRR